MSTYQHRIDVLDNWLRSHPTVYIHPDLRFAHDSSNGFHWRAVAPIEAQQRLISIPHSLCMSYLNALVDDAYPVFRNKRQEFTIEAIGFFYLMLQYIHRSTSFWRPYLDSLPSPSEETLSTPLWFDGEDEVWLRGTDLIESVNKRRLLYLQYFNTGTRILKDAGVDVSEFSWELFKWAITVFTSRSFHSTSLASQESKYWAAYRTGPDGGRQAVLLDLSRYSSADRDFSVLYPGIDIGNHDPACQALWTFDPGQFSLAVQRVITTNEQVFNNYGPKPNHELLHGYGFTIRDNPHDVVLLTLKEPKSSLQEAMKATHAGLFNSEGHWMSEKATFGLGFAKTDPHNLQLVFAKLPDLLIELLVLTVKDFHGLAYDPTSLGRVDLQSTRWRRYLPHVARILSQSLTFKYANLAEQTGLSTPETAKQKYAKHYRDGQVRILASYIDGLSGYMQYLALDHEVTASSLHLVRMEDVLDMMQTHHPTPADEFWGGLVANAHSSDLETLRAAGWEEDIWILMLCFYRLLDGTDAFSRWLGQMTAELSVDSADDYSDSTSADQITDMLKLARVAAEITKASPWNSANFDAPLVASMGRIFSNQSFLLADAAALEPRLAILWFTV